MYRNINFNVIEKYKNEDTQEISKYINITVTKLIVQDWRKTYESSYIL